MTVVSGIVLLSKCAVTCEQVDELDRDVKAQRVDAHTAHTFVEFCETLCRCAYDSLPMYPTGGDTGPLGDEYCNEVDSETLIEAKEAEAKLHRPEQRVFLLALQVICKLIVRHVERS